MSLSTVGTLRGLGPFSSCDRSLAFAARQNRVDDEAMAQKIDANWDRFLDLTLAENDIRT
jgi:hypothetical protein